MELNDQQHELVDRLLKFLVNPKAQFFALKGFAGTGKTFSIQRFLKMLPPNRYRACVTAPTNKAVSVISSFGADAGLNVPSKTTYSLLGMILDGNNEVRQCRQGSEGSLSEYDIVIVDECSMIPRVLFELLTTRLRNGQKIIFMGDPYQLNPVNEGISRSFTVPLQFMLDIPMRQAKGPILDVVMQSRQQCMSGAKVPHVAPLEDSHGNGLHLAIGDEFTELAAAQFNLKTLETDAKENRFLAWRNKTAIAFNKKVRQNLYGVNPPEFVAGEMISVFSAVFDEFDCPLLHTDDEVLITRADVGELTDFMDTKKRTYPVWWLHVTSATGKQCVIPVLHKTGNGIYNRRKNELADLANQKRLPWRSFWNFKEIFTEVRHIYGMTVHRSQGSTIPNVFLDSTDLFKNDNIEELNRLIYVGASRASLNLITNRKVLSTS